MSLAPSYYISSSPGATRDGSFGNPYGLSDLSMFGGSVKTVARNERIAFLADGNYTLPNHWTFPSGGSLTAGLLLRGCKTDGSWDETGATKATFYTGNYQIRLYQPYVVWADIHNVKDTANFVTGWVIDSAGTNNHFYNCSAENLGSRTGAAFNATSGMWGNHFFRCWAKNWNVGFGMSIDSHAAYCEADNCAIGFEAYIAARNTVMSHCVARRGSVGFYLMRHATMLHCTGDGNTQDGVKMDTSSSSAWANLFGNLMTNNGGYGYNLFTSSYQRIFGYANSGYNNTSGLHNNFVGAGSLMAVAPAAEDPAYASANDLTPTASITTLGQWLRDVGAGRNYAGALTAAGSGGTPGVSSRRATFAAMLG